MAPRRVLIVEDDPEIRSALALAMRDAGAEVVLAADGLEALQRLRAGPRPAVVLLDLRLPRLAGDGFLAAVRADPRLDRLPIITMTAGPGELAGDDIVARLHKPFDVDELRRIVETLLDP